MPPNSTVSTIEMSEKRSTDNRNNSCVPNAKQADFDTAISATGYGKYHIFLYFALVPVSWASSMDTANMSMILPSAECDLELTMFHKGILNAAVYFGMVSSGLVWGYLADVKGRKSIIIYGFLADAILNILLGFSQSFWMLFIFKYLIGCVISGPYASVMSYYSEFYSTKNRSRITLIMGSTITIGNMVNVALAWLVISQKWSIVLWDGYFVYNSWRMFLSSCGVPTLIGVMCLIFFPESPKFLMSQGRRDEALKIFRRIYSINTGQPEENYPITELADETEVAKSIDVPSGDEKSITKKSFRDGLLQMKPIFFRPHVFRLLLVVTLQFCSMLGLNTIRLWQPQIFAILENFDPRVYNIEDHDAAFCEILDVAMTSTNTSVIVNDDVGPRNCSELVIPENMYIDSMIVSGTSIVFLFVASLFVNLLGHKNLLYICYTVCVLSLISMTWSTNSILTLGLTCLFVGIMNTTLNIVIGATVILFPTSLRTMAVSLEMIMGRIGSLIGNVLFPVLLQYGCMTPIMVVACFPIVGIILAFFIPKENRKSKKVESAA